MIGNRLVRSVNSRNVRLLSSTSFRSGVWTQSQNRPSSLKLIDSKTYEDIFNGINPEKGPGSIAKPEELRAYHSPHHIDDTFKLAYNVLEAESEDYYKQIESLKERLNKVQDQKETDLIKNHIDKLLIKAERQNPEVLYNIEYFQDKIDKNQPVYREFLKNKWESHDLMVSMQRLEQLCVIPDTLPTLDPKVEVKVKFPHNVDPSFAGWVTPGEILPSFAVSQPPTIEIQEFDRIDTEQLYSVIVINPDTPDLTTNSFKTTLQYGLCNVPLNNVDNIISPAKLLANGDKYTFKEYEPLLPEKNAQTQRACLWVFRQSGPLSLDSISSDKFDVREFTSENNLTAVGAHVWRQHFDRSVNDLRSKFGLNKGRVFHRVRKPHPLVGLAN